MTHHKIITKLDAYEEILGIFRMMARVGVSMYVTPFRMAEIIKECGLSNLEVSMLRRRVIYEFNYNID